MERHIEKYFGKYVNVFHEISSPDIHVDICIIEPTSERNYYTLVTMGMGAHRMKVPEVLADKKLDRAEILVTLPSDWEIHNQAERWYWPIRWLKILAHLPGEEDSWLGYGHTIPNGEPFADNTDLCCVLLTMPCFFGTECAVCALPNGNAVNFYQIVPLYEKEVEYKIKYGIKTLEELFGDDFDMVKDIHRPSIC